MRYVLSMKAWRTAAVTSRVLLEHAQQLGIHFNEKAGEMHALPIAILSYTSQLPPNWGALPAGVYKVCAPSHGARWRAVRAGVWAGGGASARRGC